MSKLNIERTINETKGKINQYYDLRIDDIKTIMNISKDQYDLIANAFCLGYAQGLKLGRKETLINGNFK